MIGMTELTHRLIFGKRRLIKIAASAQCAALWLPRPPACPPVGPEPEPEPELGHSGGVGVAASS